MSEYELFEDEGTQSDSELLSRVSEETGRDLRRYPSRFSEDVL